MFVIQVLFSTLHGKKSTKVEFSPKSCKKQLFLHTPIFSHKSIFFNFAEIVISTYIEKKTFKVLCKVYYRAKRDKKEAT